MTASISTTKTFLEQRCPTCRMLFQPVTWLAWRVAGYCTYECSPEYKAEQEAKKNKKAPADATESTRALDLGASV